MHTRMGSWPAAGCPAPARTKPAARPTPGRAAQHKGGGDSVVREVQERRQWPPRRSTNAAVQPGHGGGQQHSCAGMRAHKGQHAPHDGDGAAPAGRGRRCGVWRRRPLPDGEQIHRLGEHIQGTCAQDQHQHGPEQAHRAATPGGQTVHKQPAFQGHHERFRAALGRGIHAEEHVSLRHRGGGAKARRGDASAALSKHPCMRRSGVAPQLRGAVPRSRCRAHPTCMTIAM